mmetsp:Transcript_15885/g.36310  ORF Transcript_15885/g.36310 Transcript_15885/m.36310 type:complete len:267 (-) Transcript_15885:2157-2957(-)
MSSTLSSKSRPFNRDEAQVSAAAAGYGETPCPYVLGCALEAKPCEECALKQPCPALMASLDMRGDASLAAQADVARGRSKPSVAGEQPRWKGTLASFPSLHQTFPSTDSRSFPSLPSGRRCVLAALGDFSCTDVKSTGRKWKSLARRIMFSQGEKHAIRAERVAINRRPSSCWIIANRLVYDVTLFLHLHPAGPQVLLKYSGSDCSEDFSFHSANAKLMWSKYAIGVLQGNEEEEEGGDEEECNQFLKGRLAAIRKMHEANKHMTC